MRMATESVGITEGKERPRATMPGDLPIHIEFRLPPKVKPRDS